MSYSCPLCHAPLSRSDNHYSCPQQHQFDLAKEGYVNLLPVQFKRSRDPGDSAEMMQARRAFLDAGHYQPLRDAIAERLRHAAPQALLDIGCGEGYYTGQLAAALPEAEGYALDISREAVKRSAKRHPQITWLVASMARLPLESASLDLIASVFSPIDWNEAARVLRTGGGILRLGPARDHLLELREKLYDEVREYQDDKHLNDLPAGFSLAHSEQLSFRLPLDSRQAREDLLSMTPHGWRVNAERREQVLAEAFEVTVAVRYDWIVNTSTPAQD